MSGREGRLRINEGRPGDATQAFRFAGKFLLAAAVIIAALWLIGILFAFSKWAGFSAVALVGVGMYATAHHWVKWLPGLLVFGILNAVLTFTTHHAPTNPQVAVSNGFAALMLAFYLVGYFVSYYYGTENLTALDRCAFLVYFGSIGWAALATGTTIGVVTPGAAWPTFIGMAAILISFVIRVRLRRTRQF